MTSAADIAEELKGMGIHLSAWTVAAIRRAAKNEGKPLSRFAPAADYRAWLRSHPTFVARAAFRTPAPAHTEPDPAPVAAGKCDE
jgi:hypothetical protein